MAAFAIGVVLTFLGMVFVLSENDALWEDAFANLYEVARASPKEQGQLDKIACAGIKHRFPFLNDQGVDVEGCKRLIKSWENRQTEK